MAFRDFFRQLFSGDERIDYFAKIFAALIASCEKIGDKDKRIESAAEVQFHDKDDRDFFAERVGYYLFMCEGNQLVINKIIKKIAHLHKVYPHWIEEMKESFLDAARSANDGLQDRVFEFIENIKTAHLNPAKETEKDTEQF